MLFSFSSACAQSSFSLIDDLFILLLLKLIFSLPILTGISRKSMIYRPLGSCPKQALNGTTFLHAFALENGADILRVHDVPEAKECVELFKLYNNTSQQ